MKKIDGNFCLKTPVAVGGGDCWRLSVVQRVARILAEAFFEAFECAGEAAAGFYATPGLGRDEVRLAYVINCDDLTRALKCLEEGLREYPGNTLHHR